MSSVRKEAEQGDVDAQFNLGVTYYRGEGAPQEYQEAVNWFRFAAGHGNAREQYLLGLVYSRDIGIPRDMVRSYA